MNGGHYVLETGCQWRTLPKDLPAKSTVHGYFKLWQRGGTLERIRHELCVRKRDLEG
jgi:transposase